MDEKLTSERMRDDGYPFESHIMQVEAVELATIALNCDWSRMEDALKYSSPFSEALRLREIQNRVWPREKR